jgi:hypothetical protein
MNANQQNFKSQRKVTEEILVFNANAERVFPQLCPTREYDWIETWECNLLYSESGYAEDLCVFQTNSPGYGPEMWMCTTYEPNLRIAYARFGEGWIIRLSFLLIESQAIKSKWKMQYAFVSTNEKGNEFLAGQPADFVTRTWKLLTKMLNYYLETGKCMKADSQA